MKKFVGREIFLFPLSKNEKKWRENEMMGKMEIGIEGNRRRRKSK